MPDHYIVRRLSEALIADSSWEVSDLAEATLDALDRLGFAVVPVAVPAEALRIAGDELEGSEATTGAERAIAEDLAIAARVRACVKAHKCVYVDATGDSAGYYDAPGLLAWLLNGDTP